MKFYCWKADGDHNAVDNCSYEAKTVTEAAIYEATSKIDYSPPPCQFIWVMTLDGDEEVIALVACEHIPPGSPTSGLSYRAAVLASTRLRIVDETKWRKAMAT